MAILNKIRSKSVFLIIIIALALFAFIFSSIISQDGFNASKQNRVASINGVDLERDDFAAKVELMSRQLGPNSTTTRAVNSVWDQEVNRVILEEQYEDLGIQVGQDRLQELLKQTFQNSAQFQDADGFYDVNKVIEYENTLEENKNSAAYQNWAATIESIKNNEKQEIFYNLVKAGLGATLKDGEAAYKLDTDKVNIEYVQIPFTSIPDTDVEVTKEDIQSYMNTHPDDYKTDATRSIQFVKFDETASLEDENSLKAELTALNKERVVTNRAAQSTETLPGFAETEDVEAFVSENSDLPYQDQFFFKNQLPKEFADELFSKEKGEIYGPYKDGNYMKISRIVDVKQMSDSIQVKRILIDYNDAIVMSRQGATKSTSTRTKEEAKDLADSIFNVVKRDASKFEDLAKEYSAEAFSKAKGGDVGYQNPNNFDEKFMEFILDNNEGAMDVVETDFGYFVTSITDKTADEKAMNIATVAKEIAPSDNTLSSVYNATQKFEIAAKAGNFQDVAVENNYNVRPVQGILAMEENLPGEGSQRSIVQWAFEDETKVGDIKRFSVNNGFIVAQVTRATKKGLKRTEDVSTLVTPILRNEKKAEIIKSKISGSDLNAIASAQNETVKSASALSMTSPTIAGAGNEPKVVGAAFGLKEGEVSKPITGVRGVYVVKTTKRTDAPVLENYGSYAVQEANKSRAAVATKVLSALKEAAEIEDNRATFY